MFKHASITALVVSLSLCTAGCLVGGSSRVVRSGTYVSPETLNAIEPGKTNSAWVIATLGDPAERSQVEPGHEVWKYTYNETRDSGGYVFLIFGGHDRQVITGKVFVELKDGIVAKTWRS